MFYNMLTICIFQRNIAYFTAFEGEKMFSLCLSKFKQQLVIIFSKNWQRKATFWQSGLLAFKSFSLFFSPSFLIETSNAFLFYLSKWIYIIYKWIYIIFLSTNVTKPVTWKIPPLVYVQLSAYFIQLFKSFTYLI